jgi:hypothetical protein
MRYLTEFLVKACPDHILELEESVATADSLRFFALDASTTEWCRGVRKWEWDCLAQQHFNPLQLVQKCPEMGMGLFGKTALYDLQNSFKPFKTNGLVAEKRG